MEKVAKKKRQALKRELMWGDQKLIEKISGASRDTVMRWFKGESNHPKILPAVKAIIKKREEELQRNINELL